MEKSESLAKQKAAQSEEKLEAVQKEMVNLKKELRCVFQYYGTVLCLSRGVFVSV